MPSKSPVVPSKSALRALRRLALQGSTVLGAVGSFCGAAALNYDARQRVKFAEQILDTKRTIQSMSNGSGAEHIQRMFEAAERGEEFGLDTRKASQRRKRRNFSAVAADPRAHAEGDDGRKIASDLMSAKKDALDRDSILRKHIHERLENVVSRKGLSSVEEDRLVRDTAISASTKSSLQASHRLPPKGHKDVYKEFQEGQLKQRGIAWVLNKSATPQRRKPTDHSSEPISAPSSWPEFQEELELQQSRRNREHGQSHYSQSALANNTTTADKIMAATLQQHKLGSHTVYGRPDNPKKAPKSLDVESRQSKRHTSREALAAEKIIAATQEQHKLASHAVYGRPQSIRTRAGLAGGLDYLLEQQRTGQSRSQSRKMSTRTSIARSGVAEISPVLSTSSRQQSTATARKSDADEIDYAEITIPGEPPSHERRDIANNPSHQMKSKKSAEAPEFGLLNSGFRDWPRYIRKSHYPRIQPDKKSPNKILMDEWNPDPTKEDKGNTEKDSRTASQPLDASKERIAQSTVVPATSPLKELPLKIIRDDVPREEKLLSQTTLSAIEHDESRKRIRLLLETDRFDEAAILWSDTLDAYATPGPSYSMEGLQALHNEFRTKFYSYVNVRPLRILARHLFKKNPRSAEAAWLLFPLRPDTRARARLQRVSQKQLFHTAFKYLADIWDGEEEHNVDNIVSQLDVVVAAAIFCDVQPTEDIFARVLIWLCSVGAMVRAQEVFDRMEKVYSIRPTIWTRATMIRGYAAASNWDRVAQEMEAMHATGYSRLRPNGYALLFNGVLREYAAQFSLIQTYDYVSHAIGYWGLVPTSIISTTMIQLCLTFRRFDLVLEWTENVRLMFPQVQVANSAEFAWQVAQTWKQIHASCEDVEATCLALACRHRGYAFRGIFKDIVRAALAEDLGRKLQSIGRSKKDEQRDSDDKLKDLAEYLEQAHVLRLNAKAGADATKREDIMRQVRAVIRLNEFFSIDNDDFLPSRMHNDPDNESRSTSYRPAHSSRPVSIISTFPEPLLGEFLPSFQKVKSLVFNYYEARANDGFLVNHLIVEYVCEKLKRRQRLVDVVTLLDDIHTTLDQPRGPAQQDPSDPLVDSKLACTQPARPITADLTILTMWLRCTFELKSLPQLRNVLWAVLDETYPVRLSTSFILLARMAVFKLRRGRFSEANAEQLTELQYLLGRLKQRYLDQTAATSMTGKAQSTSSETANWADQVACIADDGQEKWESEAVWDPAAEDGRDEVEHSSKGGYEKRRSKQSPSPSWY